jgi:transposase-like protein
MGENETAQAETTAYFGIAVLAERYSVDKNTVGAWVTRHGPGTGSGTPLPTPAASVRQDGRDIHGWSDEQFPELDAWVKRHSRKATVPEA